MGEMQVVQSRSRDIFESLPGSLHPGKPLLPMEFHAEETPGLATYARFALFGMGLAGDY
jgi:hypothetical protein